MSYRDDLGAAQARADAAEHRAAALQKRIDDLDRTKRAEAASAGKHVPIPERFEVVLDEDTLRVRWRWFRLGRHLWMLVFTLVWDVFVGVAVFGTIVSHGMSWTLLAMVAHIGAGVGLTYSLIAGLFNRTTVTASPGRLEIAHAPIPWRGNRILSTAQIRQLYVVERTNDETTRYDLCAVLDGDRQLKLLKGFEYLEQARYVERAFELHLGIEDREIADEPAKR